MQNATTKLLPSRSGNLGIIQLNNPKAYHALDLDMIRASLDVLSSWFAQDSGIQAILWKSSDDTKLKRPAFCPGGNVKALALALRDEPHLPHGQGQSGVLTADFFREEYYLNHALHSASNNNKIQISLWDGLVMGGGVGISQFGQYRVATENTVWAMPETAIGFFPDVGSLWILPRLLQQQTTKRLSSVLPYLALTGHRLTPSDLIYTGLATHYIPSKDLPALQSALVEATTASTSADSVAPVLLSFHQPPPDPHSSFLAQHLDTLNQVFGSDDNTIPEIVARLQSLDSDFGRTTLETLHKMSPTALHLTLELLRRGQQLSLADHLALEYRLTQHLMAKGVSGEFFEGIRATLLERGTDPQWNPATLQDMDPVALVHDYFEQPIAHEWNVTDSPIVFDSSKEGEASKL